MTCCPRRRPIAATVGNFLPQGPSAKASSCAPGGLRIGSVAHRLKCSREALALLPRRQRCQVADQVHDAGLDLGLRVHGLDGLGEATQPIDNGN